MSDTICLIATVRSPVGELMQFVERHLAAGIREMFLFFDDPLDIAADSVAIHPGVVPFRCDSNYWRALRMTRPTAIEARQVANVNFGMAIARSRELDWLIHIDSDELLYSRDDIATVLTGLPADVVRFAMKEAVAERDHYSSRFEATLFREPLTPAAKRELAALDQAEVLFEGEYFRGHQASKVAVRLASKLQVMGIHGPHRPRNMPEVKTTDITLLHFDCIGVDDWKRKWSRRRDTSGTATEMRSARSKQLELFERAYGDTAQELALYRRLHTVTEAQKRLLIPLGLLTVIDFSTTVGTKAT